MRKFLKREKNFSKKEEKIFLEKTFRIKAPETLEKN